MPGQLGGAAGRTPPDLLTSLGTDQEVAIYQPSTDAYWDYPRPFTAGHGGVNPYDALFGGVPWYSVLDGIPVDRLQALPVDYGKPRR